MKKFAAFFMAAVLCMGISVTALAANSPTPSTGDGGSGEVVTPSTGDTGDYLSYYSDIYYWYGLNAKVVSGSGTVSPISDSVDMELIYEDVWATALVDCDEMFNSGMFVENLEPDQMVEGGYICASYAFDVDNPAGGLMVISLGDGAQQYAGCLALVYHYNGTGWEKMSAYGLVDDDGQIAISFDSYSPIFVAVTSYTKDSVAAGQSINVLTADGVTTLSNASTSSDETSPKTGNSMGLIVVLIGICAFGGAAVTRKFAVR